MTDFMSVDQIISAAKNDIDDKIERGLFTGDQGTEDDNEENFYTVESLYCQWARDRADAELKLWDMYHEDYPEWFKE